MQKSSFFFFKNTSYIYKNDPKLKLKPYKLIKTKERKRKKKMDFREKVGDFEKLRIFEG